MQRDAAVAGIELVRKIDICAGLLGQMAQLKDGSPSIMRIVLRLPDDTKAELDFTDNLGIIADDKNTIGQALASILTQRKAAYEEQLAAL